MNKKESRYSKNGALRWYVCENKDTINKVEV